jgi:cell division ATPase FtsA
MVQEDNLVFVHIGSEITEVGIIEEDTLSYFATFPIGIHDFLRILQTTVKSYDYDLLQQSELQLKSEVQKESFESLASTWTSSVVQILENFNKNIPHKYVIISDSKVKNFFTIALSKYAQSNPQSILRTYRIIDFDISLLKDIITHKTPVGENEIDLKLEALI